VLNQISRRLYKIYSTPPSVEKLRHSKSVHIIPHSTHWQWEPRIKTFHSVSTRHNIIGTVISVWAEWPTNCGWRPHRAKTFFLRHPDQMGGTNQPPVQCLWGAISTGVKWMWQHNNNPPPNAKVKQRGSYTSIPPYAFMACSKGNFLFSYTAFVLKCKCNRRCYGRGRSSGRKDATWFSDTVNVKHVIKYKD
jgi:hypothetical protein